MNSQNAFPSAPTAPQTDDLLHAAESLSLPWANLSEWSPIDGHGLPAGRMGSDRIDLPEWGALFLHRR